MKLTTTNGVVTITSESQKEALELFSFGLTYKNPVVKKTEPIEKKRKRYQLTYPCPHCNRFCKGKGGLNVHLAHSHRAEWLKAKDAKRLEQQPTSSWL
jgi:predicted nucleic acid binding AN1-type Zn finger protein